MPEKSSQKSGRILKRAIARNDPTKERPTVGKPVIIDPPVKRPSRKAAQAKHRNPRRSSIQEG
jgi:hypothetical protein